MSESLLELRELILTWTFLSVAITIVLLVVVGGGHWRPRWRKVVFLAALLAVVGTFAAGVLPHQDRGQEWSEVLFNGQLL